MEYQLSILWYFKALSLLTASTPVKTMDFPALPIRTGVIALLVGQRPAICVCTTDIRYFGDQRCRRPRPQAYRQRKLSTTRPQRLLQRCFTFTTSSRIWASPNKPSLWCTRTTRRASSGENHAIGGRERAKHIDIQKHFAHEVIQNGKMKLIHVSTVSQLADILTKQLHFPQWQACVAGILNKKVATT